MLNDPFGPTTEERAAEAIADARRNAAAGKMTIPFGLGFVLLVFGAAAYDGGARHVAYILLGFGGFLTAIVLAVIVALAISIFAEAHEKTRRRKVRIEAARGKGKP